MISESQSIILRWLCNGSFEWRAVGVEDRFPYDVLQLYTLFELPSAGRKHVPAFLPRRRWV